MYQIFKNLIHQLRFLMKKINFFDTGGGALKASKFFKNKPFIIINPDTIWSSKYNKELKLLTKLYIKNRKPCLLLVNKI